MLADKILSASLVTMKLSSGIKLINYSYNYMLSDPAIDSPSSSCRILSSFVVFRST